VIIAISSSRVALLLARLAAMNNLYSQYPVFFSCPSNIPDSLRAA
jgi:hypothetical protein